MAAKRRARAWAGTVFVCCLDVNLNLAAIDDRSRRFFRLKDPLPDDERSWHTKSMNDAWKAAGLLVLSNTFMTTAWYGHLRYPKANVWAAIFASWGIALFEYVLQVPANRIGHHVLSGYQLKVLQEAITLCVFVVFARFALDERLTPRHALAFVLIFAAVAITMKK